jgi:hypothetical protein
MDGVGSAEGEHAGTDPPLTAEVLADLQAGLLDDDTAARVRKRVRADPDAQRIVDALNRVRRNIAALESDESSAPAVAPEVFDRIAAALRAERPAHTVSPARLPRSARLAIAVAGLAAATAAVAVGAAALITAPPPAPSRPTTAEHITVARPPATIPLSDAQLLALLGRDPDYGPLADPQRRASCLAGLGYPPAVGVLGARPVEISGHPAILLLLPADTPGTITVLAVAPTCSSANTGLLADRIVNRP